MPIDRVFLVVLAASTERELARQVKFLKVENEILRGKLPERITVTPKERRRLMKFGAKLGKALRELVTIVHPSTFLRWLREDARQGKRRKGKPAKRGRPKSPEEIRALILRLAKENSWKYSRILGELKKLGIKSISRNTVKNAPLRPWIETVGLEDYSAHYHTERPHQGRDRNNEPLIAYKFPDSADGKVVCHQRLAGLLKHYVRKAA